MHYLARKPCKGGRDSVTTRREGEIQIDHAFTGNSRAICGPSSSERAQGGGRRAQRVPSALPGRRRTGGVGIYGFGKAQPRTDRARQHGNCKCPCPRWLDRGDDFDAHSLAGRFIAPLVIPRRAASICRGTHALRIQSSLPAHRIAANGPARRTRSPFARDARAARADDAPHFSSDFRRASRRQSCSD